MYKKLDATIVTAIGGGRRSFTEIHLCGAVAREASRLGEQTGSPDWRIVDRRLQAMRKAGRIAYTRATGWTVQA